MANSTSNASGSRKLFYGMAIVMMSLAILSVGKPVLIPIALSILLAFILNPLVKILESWRVGRVFAVLIATTLAFGMIGLAGWALATQIKSLADELPDHTKEIKAKIAIFETSSSSTFGRLKRMGEEILGEEEKVEKPANPISQILGSTAEPKITTVKIAEAPTTQFTPALEALVQTIEPLATAALVIVLVLFLLLQREDVRYRIIVLMGDSSLTGTTRVLGDAAGRVSSYLFYLLLVNTVFGVWFGVGLYLLGVPYAPLWGFLTLFFRFIPFLGSPASVLFPLLISVATSNGWGQPLGLLLFFGVSELVTANVIEPILFGKTTGLTPIALLIAALFWAWVWGPVGLLLSTPLTVCLVVLGQHLPKLSSLKVLLAEQPMLDNRLQFSQRLLANDTVEARKILQTHYSEFGSAASFDEIIVPALRWTRRERAKDVIDAKEEQNIWDNNQKLVDELKQQRLEGALSEQEEESVKRALPSDVIEVIGYPVHHRSEEIALTLLGELTADLCGMESCSTKTLPSRALEKIESVQPSIVVLAVLPPGGMPQVDFMCRQLSTRLPGTQLIVMYLGNLKDYDKTLVELRNKGATYLTTSLRQTHDQISSILDERNRAEPDLVHLQRTDPASIHEPVGVGNVAVELRPTGVIDAH